MNHAPHLYFAWQQLVEKSRLMLYLASEELWDELIASEMEYVNAVQQIARLTEEIAPSVMMQEQLKPMLRLVLGNESKIKQLLQIRMDELAKRVDQSSMQKSLLSTYGNQGGYVLAPLEHHLKSGKA
ncbi:flagella biosynthesis regulatory protein FliT [Escherichia albertii]|uniref:flagella biosynthesis regulatory protein FliT n=1 Tax=Escherichia albertii TaxID=208962 RepID=UPI0007439232|nr:flagella biosynthesis regulatory protein FliT [Escherichia albertii]MDN4003301.1 flagella biosynthesis regulatory protein FliT [Escherichia albertii]QST48472.1 flagella biosynthesis regulatory protein FliT [Escherichia albertii]WDB44886.1 flagella biosynthesis regulatory protein FliT [Escherichia albertii]HEB1164949.1 flagella biosynthesis regulatory protein FliT [Escherichia albertii]HEB1254724.1 flagella biosynthesis regulatory protein FliT [Escherichia albertii]